MGYDTALIYNVVKIYIIFRLGVSYEQEKSTQPRGWLTR